MAEAVLKKNAGGRMAWRSMAVTKMLRCWPQGRETRPPDQDAGLLQRSITVGKLPVVIGQEFQPEHSERLTLPHNDWGSAGVTQTPWNWLEQLAMAI